MPEHDSTDLRRHTCPSAQPDMAGAVVFGVITSEEEDVKVAYVNEKVPISEELLTLCHDRKATSVLRIAAPCQEHRCVHFNGHDCQLARRIVQILPAVVEQLPPCVIRPECLWYHQEGANACKRCPQIVTYYETADPVLIDVAKGPCAPDGTLGAS